MRRLMLPATASATFAIAVTPAAAVIVVTATADTVVVVVVALSTGDVVVPCQSKFVFFLRTCHVCRTHINIILNRAPHIEPWVMAGIFN